MNSVLSANLAVVNRHREKRKQKPFGIVCVAQPKDITAGPYIITLDNSVYHGGLTEAGAEEYLAGMNRVYMEWDQC
jgi:hypothetical protein